jgi:hypothetical protein
MEKKFQMKYLTSYRREHPALQNMKLFSGSADLIESRSNLDPDPKYWIYPIDSSANPDAS